MYRIKRMLHSIGVILFVLFVMAPTVIIGTCLTPIVMIIEVAVSTNQALKEYFDNLLDSNKPL